MHRSQNIIFLIIIYARDLLTFLVEQVGPQLDELRKTFFVVGWCSSLVGLGHYSLDGVYLLSQMKNYCYDHVLYLAVRWFQPRMMKD